MPQGHAFVTSSCVSLNPRHCFTQFGSRNVSLKCSAAEIGLNESRGKFPRREVWENRKPSLRVSLKSRACIWMTNLCVSPPFKKSFASAETPGPGLGRLYISIHNWWPGPRQTAHYTCNMDSLSVSDACPRLDLTLSHHCVCGGAGGEGREGAGKGVCVCENVRPCTCLCPK